MGGGVPDFANMPPELQQALMEMIMQIMESGQLPPELAQIASQMPQGGPQDMGPPQQMGPPGGMPMPPMGGMPGGPPQGMPQGMPMPGPGVGMEQGGPVSSESMEDIHDRIAELKQKLKKKEQEIKEKYAPKKPGSQEGPPRHPLLLAEGGNVPPVPPPWWTGTAEEWTSFTQNAPNKWPEHPYGWPKSPRSGGLGPQAEGVLEGGKSWYPKSVPEKSRPRGVSEAGFEWPPSWYGGTPEEWNSYSDDQRGKARYYNDPEEIQSRRSYADKHRLGTGVTEAEPMWSKAGSYQGRLLKEDVAPMKTPSMAGPDLSLSDKSLLNLGEEGDWKSVGKEPSPGEWMKARGYDSSWDVPQSWGTGSKGAAPPLEEAMFGKGAVPSPDFADSVSRGGYAEQPQAYNPYLDKPIDPYPGSMAAPDVDPLSPEVRYGGRDLVSSIPDWDFNVSPEAWYDTLDAVASPQARAYTKILPYAKAAGRVLGHPATGALGSALGPALSYLPVAEQYSADPEAPTYTDLRRGGLMTKDFSGSLSSAIKRAGVGRAMELRPELFEAPHMGPPKPELLYDEAGFVTGKAPGRFDEVYPGSERVTYGATMGPGSSDEGFLAPPLDRFSHPSKRWRPERKVMPELLSDPFQYYADMPYKDWLEKTGFGSVVERGKAYSPSPLEFWNPPLYFPESKEDLAANWPHGRGPLPEHLKP